MHYSIAIVGVSCRARNSATSRLVSLSPTGGHPSQWIFIFCNTNLHNTALMLLPPSIKILFHYETLSDMEVELLWRRPKAPSVAIRGGLRLLRLAELVRNNRAAIGGPSKRQQMNSLVSSWLGSTWLRANPQWYQVDV